MKGRDPSNLFCLPFCFFPFQGDVGCGKTIVAFLACMEVIGLGFQVGKQFVVI